MGEPLCPPLFYLSHDHHHHRRRHRHRRHRHRQVSKSLNELIAFLFYQEFACFCVYPSPMIRQLRDVGEEKEQQQPNVTL